MDWTNAVSPILIRNSKTNLTLIWSNWMKFLKSIYHVYAFRIWMGFACLHLFFILLQIGVCTGLNSFRCYMVRISFNEGRAQKIVQISLSHIRCWCIGMKLYLYTIRSDVTFFGKICYILDLDCLHVPERSEKRQANILSELESGKIVTSE